VAGSTRREELKTGFGTVRIRWSLVAEDAEKREQVI
jgi:hypothetical protein